MIIEEIIPTASGKSSSNFLRYVHLPKTDDTVNLSRVRIYSDGVNTFAGGISGRPVIAEYKQGFDADAPKSSAFIEMFLGKNFDNEPEKKIVLHFASPEQPGDSGRPFQLKFPKYQFKTLRILLQLRSIVNTEFWYSKNWIVAVNADLENPKYSHLTFLDSDKNTVKNYFTNKELAEMGVMNNKKAGIELTKKQKSEGQAKLIERLLQEILEIVEKETKAGNITDLTSDASDEIEASPEEIAAQDDVGF